jgi:acyl carrier protein
VSDVAVIAAIAAELEMAPADLRLDGRFAEDYAADSLDFVRLVMAVEEAAGVKIEDKLAVQARTVGALIDLARNSPPAKT